MSKLKTAIVVDSGSMIKYDEMKDVYVVPMAVIKCENKHDITFRDGKDINVKTMLKEMTEGTIYKTASPIMGECSDLLEKISDKYDEIYILSTPKCVSGTFQQ
jgi:fatty acid-binding protein DegV